MVGSLKPILLLGALYLGALFVAKELDLSQERDPAAQCRETVHRLPYNLYGLPTSSRGIWKKCQDPSFQAWMKKIRKISENVK